MNAAFCKRLFVVCGLLGIATACGGGSSTPPLQQFGNTIFSSVIFWQSTPDGAPAGSSEYVGDAIVTTIPFDASPGGGASDAGALPNRAAFFLAGGAGVSPQQLGSLRNNPLSWNASANVVALASAPAITPPPSAPPGSLSVPSEYVAGGTAAGSGTLSASVQNAPVPIITSVPVFTYRVVDVGCTDTGALSGVSFATNGSYQGQSSLLAPAGDLYVTGPSCANFYNDLSGAYTIHTPYGATLLATGPIARANGMFYSNEQNPNFTQIAASAWKADFTSIDEATFDADINPPCVAISPSPVPLPSGVPNPFPTVSGCTSTPDDVLVLKTQGGAIVKLYIALAHDGTTSGRNILGAYEVTNASGSFPY